MFAYVTLECLALVCLAEMPTAFALAVSQICIFFIHVSVCISTDIQCSLAEVPEKEMWLLENRYI